nr:hypothetical protein [Mycobacterium leprae]
MVHDGYLLRIGTPEVGDVIEASDRLLYVRHAVLVLCCGCFVGGG